MSNHLPEVKHKYVSRSLNSLHWEHYSPRDDDIVVATSYKAGTTWMQTIVLHLIFQEFKPFAIGSISPWLDSRFCNIDDATKLLEEQSHRRCIKTHLALDGLLYFPQIKYIVVTRDIRDIFMSMWNHYSNFTTDFLERMNEPDDLIPDRFSQAPDDIRDFWQMWMTRGTFAWESDGFPFWSTIHHLATWWEYRYLKNIYFVHYNNLLANPAKEIRGVANFLEISITEDALALIVNAVSFDTMKRNAEAILPGIGNAIQGGGTTFINKGSNGRWRDVLTENDLQLYDNAVQRQLSLDCIAWLENAIMS